jgi:N-dimethylarginine dimethylaminohydrolase
MEQDTQSLYHAVEVTNKAEKAYLMEWLEAQGIDSSKLEGLFKFPMLVYTIDGTWMTEYEKVETTSSFREFINSLEVEDG